MIAVNDVVKRAYREDGYIKGIEVQFPNNDHEALTNDDIVSESLKLVESCCSQNELKFGLCEASMVEFDAFLSENLEGYEIKVFSDVYASHNYDHIVETYNMMLGATDITTDTIEISINSYFDANKDILQFAFNRVLYRSLEIDDGNGYVAYNHSTEYIPLNSQVKSIRFSMGGGPSPTLLPNSFEITLKEDDRDALNRNVKVVPSNKEVMFTLGSYISGRFHEIRSLREFNYIQYAYCDIPASGTPTEYILIEEPYNGTYYKLPNINEKGQFLYKFGVRFDSSDAIGTDVMHTVFVDYKKSIETSIYNLNNIDFYNFSPYTYTTPSLVNHKVIVRTEEGNVVKVGATGSTTVLYPNEDGYVEVTEATFGSATPELLITIANSLEFKIDYYEVEYTEKYSVNLGNFIIESCERENTQSDIRHIRAYSHVAYKNWQLPRSYVEAITSSIVDKSFNHKLSYNDIVRMMFPAKLYNMSDAKRGRYIGLAGTDTDTIEIPFNAPVEVVNGYKEYGRQYDLLDENNYFICNNGHITKVRLEWYSTSLNIYEEHDIFINESFLNKDIIYLRINLQNQVTIDNKYSFDKCYIREVNISTGATLLRFDVTSKKINIKITGKWVSENESQIGNIYSIKAFQDDANKKLVELFDSVNFNNYYCNPQYPETLQGRLIKKPDDLRAFTEPLATMWIPDCNSDYIRVLGKKNGIDVSGVYGKTSIRGHAYYQKITPNAEIFAVPGEASEISAAPDSTMGLTGTAKRVRSNLCGSYFVVTSDMRLFDFYNKIKAIDDKNNIGIGYQQQISTVIKGEFSNDKHLFWIPRTIQITKDNEVISGNNRYIFNWNYAKFENEGIALNKNNVNYQPYYITTDIIANYFVNTTIVENIQGDLIQLDANGQKLLEGFLELEGKFGKISRTNTFLTRTYAKREENPDITYPSESLYPSDFLYPRNAMNIAETYTEDDYVSQSLVVNDYDGYMYDKIICEYTDTSGNASVMVKQVLSDSEKLPNVVYKTYTISNNEVIKNTKYSKNELSAILDNMVANIKNVGFYPIKVNALGFPWLEAGDRVEFESNGKVYDTYILRRTLSGIQDLKDNIESFIG